MTTPDPAARAEFIAMLRQPNTDDDRFGALDAVLAGNVMPDGTPVCSATIGELMTKYAAEIEASLGQDTT